MLLADTKTYVFAKTMKSGMQVLLYWMSCSVTQLTCNDIVIQQRDLQRDIDLYNSSTKFT